MSNQPPPPGPVQGVTPQQPAVVPAPAPPQQQPATIAQQGVQPPVRPGAGNRAHRDSRRSGWNIKKATAEDLQRSSEATVRAGMRIARQFFQQLLQSGYQGATVTDGGSSSGDSSDGNASNEESSGEREDERKAPMNTHVSTANGSVQASNTHCCIVEEFDPSKDADQIYVEVTLPDGELAAGPRRAFYGADGVRAAALQWDIRGSRGLIQEIQPGHFLMFTQEQRNALDRAQHSTTMLVQLPDVWAQFALHGARIPASPSPAPIDGLVVTQSEWEGLDRLKAPSAVKMKIAKAQLWEMCPKTVSSMKEQLRHNRSLDKAGQEVDERLRPVDDEADHDNDGLVSPS
ncbi:hypothetical protein KC318_g374 [Hortaea werneckii]|nr:hypothetical protein KC334_g377 [Hortaea werneckii]KAI7026379.1 hypothetical protein KC355_g678 [Hortaea werneckii]KAI7205173.1 hypothetical protein KC324_g441 [Hortaea werneckii]KAI7595634.1 hypothetical protein KC316_g397 [Hortaea werneckii]KAI7676275.1 hypothetical protein KC318_g374 [Hortaea werneckii]